MTELHDGLQRRIDYLRVSLTDRCDLRCSYCLPKGYRDFDARADWLSAEEIEQVVAAFARLGVRRVRLTGGEPLTRADATEIAGRIASLPGIADLSLTTNATQLARLGSGLFHAGVRRLNVSLDSLDHGRFARITGRDVLPDVLAGLDVARFLGFAPIKINMVALSDLAAEEIEAMVDYCIAQGFVLRLIEPMPMGDAGRSVRPADMTAIRARLLERFDLVDALVPGGGPARYLRSTDGRFTVGFITPLSQHFCPTCNRVRLSAEGKLYLCLGQDDAVDLRQMLRTGATATDIENAIVMALARKPAQHEFSTTPHKMVRVMAKTGG